MTTWALESLTNDELLGRLSAITKKSRRIEAELIAHIGEVDHRRGYASFASSIMRKLPESRVIQPLRRDRQLGPDLAATSKPDPKPVLLTPSKPTAVKPTGPARYRVSFTASSELHDKLERLRALMRSSVPDGDLAALIEEAVTEKLERIEAKRYAKTKTPRKSLEETDTRPSTRHIPAAVKRAVVARDRKQCAHVDPQGRRCTERSRLEFHHINPYGRGGDHSPENIALRCRSHNRYQAELDYGKDLLETYRRSASRACEPAVVYGFGDRTTLRCRPVSQGIVFPNM